MPDTKPTPDEESLHFETLPATPVKLQRYDEATEFALKHVQRAQGQKPSQGNWTKIKRDTESNIVQKGGDQPHR
jgi:hypothetical protein